MSKVIRISETIFKRLQLLARPLVDTPGDVIEGLLDFYEENKNTSGSIGLTKEETMREANLDIFMNKLVYREPRQRGINVKINGQVFKAISVKDLYSQVLKFLYTNGYLEKIKKDLPIYTSKARFLINTRPIHPKGNAFWEPVEYRGFFMEAHKDYKNGINHLKKMLDKLQLSLTLE